MNRTLKNKISEKLTAEERAKLMVWKQEYALSADKINAFLSEMESGDQSLTDYAQYDKGAAWQKLADQNGIRTETKVIKPRFNWYAIAASLAVLMVSIFALNIWLGGDTALYDQNFAQVERIDFPDGSMAQVDEGARIKYSVDDFTDVRNLELDGRAYFEVESDERRSFKVKTSKFDVEVLGTKFIVNAKKGFESVKVVEGKVKVSTPDSEYIITANEQVNLSEDGQFVKSNISNTSSNLLSWNTATLTFDDTPIADMLADIEAHYEVNITMSGENDLSCKHNTVFRKETLESVLDEIALAFDAKYSVNDDQITITGIQCN